MIVIKIGGGKTINLETIIADLKFVDQQYLVVHGANALRNDIAKKLGHELKTATSVSGYSSVLTDDDAMDIFMMTYSGLRNKRLVEMAQKYDINAIGLTGLDGRLIQGKRKTVIKAKIGNKVKALRDDLSGKPEKLNVELLQSLISSGYVPFITPPILSHEGQALNTDNDSIITLLVKELGSRAPKLSIGTIIHLLEAPGLLKDPNNSNSIIMTVKKTDLDHIEKQYTQGRMKRKMLAVRQAFDYGVKKVIFADGRVDQPIQKALKDKGTIIN